MCRPLDLTDKEETALIGLLMYMAQQGVPATTDVLRAKVRDLVNSFVELSYKSVFYV